MKPDYEIALGRGIGAILLGMTKKDLIGLLGEPDETYIPEEDEKTGCETFGYDVIKCSFSFDEKHEDRLIEIQVENGYFHIAHKIRVGLKKEELLKLCGELQFGECVIRDMRNDEFPTRELISYDHSGLHFGLDNGIISSIHITPLYSQAGWIIWPEEPEGTLSPED
jgi:hypothetical protein